LRGELNSTFAKVTARQAKENKKLSSAILTGQVPPSLKLRRDRQEKNVKEKQKLQKIQTTNKVVLLQHQYNNI